MGDKKKPTDAPPPKPQFFRILLAGSGFATKLSLPRPLTKYFIKENLKSATILSPLGKYWSIKVHQNIKSLFFGDGWQDFAQAHDLHEGYVLVFSYEGDMVFNVAIFDPNACEKEYIPMEQNNVTNNRITKEEQTSADDSHTKLAMHSGGISKLPTHSQESMASEPSACLWEQPFKVTMRRSYIGPKSQMNVPDQASRYLWGTDIIVLRDPEQRLWPVKLYHRLSGTRKRSAFGFGWLEFRINNHLEEGDVCIFELISKEKKVMLNVHIQKHEEQNLKNISNRKRTIEARKHLTSSATQRAEKKLKLVHSQNQKTIPHSFQLLNDLSGVHQVFHVHRKNKAPTSFDPITCEKDYIATVQNDDTNNRIKIEEQNSDNDSEGKLTMRSKRTSKLPAHSPYCKGFEQCTCLIGQQFKVIIRPSYIGRHTCMNIPSHASQYLLGIEKIVLRDPEERMWPVKLYHRRYAPGKLRSALKSVGWREFHVNNNLVEGDVCIFELISKEKNAMPIMDVHIQKHGQDSKQDSNRQRTVEARKSLTSSSTLPAVKKVKLVNCQDQKVSEAMGPSTPASLFKATIKSRNLLPKRPYLNIPSSFPLLNDLSSVQQIIIRDPKRRRWPVKVIHRKKKTRTYACFGFGWQDFCASNNLEEGDMCIFELVSKEKNAMPMMDVHIQKHGQDSKQDSNRQSIVEARKSLTSSSTQPAVKKIKLVHSQDLKVAEAMGPSTPTSLFKATIKSWNLLPKRPYMNIPSSFRLLNDLSGVQQIILRDPKRRRWPVKIIHQKEMTRTYACFGSGWQDFCASNNLEGGDVCIFELVENSNVMIVDIIKEEQVRTELQSDPC